MIAPRRAAGVLWCFLLADVLTTPASGWATANAGLNDFQARAVNYNGTGNAYPYRLFVPDGYNLPENASRKYPVVLFMHGLGEGPNPSNNSSQVTGAGAPVLGLVTGANRDSFPAFIVCPQIVCAPGAPNRTEWTWGDNTSGTPFNTKRILDKLAMEFRIDPDKIFVTGLSLGAMGVWAQLQYFPGYYAGGLPMSWNNPIRNAGSPALMAQVPLWVFYGDQDSYRYTSWNDPVDDVNLTRAAGGYVVFSRYPDGTHGTNTWGTSGNTRGLYTPGLMQWLMGQKRGMINNQAPLISLTTPATGSTYTTAGTTLNLTGTTSEAMGGGGTRTVSSLVWSNDRGGSGTASGLASWLVNGISLQSGSNKIQILATDNQNTTFNFLFTVTQAVSPLETWRTEQFGAQATDPAMAGNLMDPDGDGLANLLEYALGGDPKTPGNVRPVITVAGGQWQMVFTRPAPAGVSYVVQSSTDLVTWQEVARCPAYTASWTGTATVSETGSGATRQVTVQGSVDGGPGKFLRLQVWPGT